MHILNVRSILLAMVPALLLATTTRADEPASSAPVQAQAAEEDPMVCKRVAVTGSRVKKEKICKTQREWETYSQRAKEFMRGIDRRGAHQAGGESLPNGG